MLEAGVNSGATAHGVIWCDGAGWYDGPLGKLYIRAQLSLLKRTRQCVCSSQGSASWKSFVLFGLIAPVVLCLLISLAIVY